MHAALDYPDNASRVDVALSYQQVSRTFDRGRFLAVRDVSLDVHPGEIHSVIGPNGAGKTALIKMAAIILTPTAGRVVVNGFNTASAPMQARRSLGLMIGGELGFYPRATAQQNLQNFADLVGVDGRERDCEVGRVQRQAERRRTKNASRAKRYLMERKNRANLGAAYEFVVRPARAK